MSNSFAMNEAIDLILEHEGGYVNDPDDPGGETNFGISKRAYPKLDIANLTKEEARKIYASDYYLKAGCERLPVGVDVSVFDMAVNAGIKRALKLLQKAVGVAQDGIVGPITMAAVVRQAETLPTAYAVERINFYRKLKTWQHFGGGWALRTAKTAHFAMKMRTKQQQWEQA